ncbi:LIM/homeobox protein lim-4 [Caenorhabditis elegans]|uniref:Isoform b of LIM/homeobox protein lim-4 n=1 Tax=Caenorhabditis elegans TaxID=6239 RepID=G5EEA1-2|nr:LIM/homeobox protein lim-4 [Caenorhabditis elegans]SMQ44709.1 LIM/homeobox protein lim-4 [Caenorhabditis elegans]|eukprot:NP_001338856.1 LIM domain family [Caenorhabditis elegans]
MDAHLVQAKKTSTASELSDSSLTFPFIGDYLSSPSLTTSDYVSDCSNLTVEGPVPANQEFSSSDESSVYISSALRLADYAFTPDDNIRIKPDAVIVICTQCQHQIQDKFFLSIDGRNYHENCLQCSTCENPLSNKCFYKDKTFYCKGCYFRCRELGPKCASCDRTIQATDWVRRARNYVYHLACFSCNQCKRQLSTGEEYALQEGNLLCKQHFLELVEGDSGVSSQKAKTKRVRTTFAEDQLSVLQTYFNRDSNPDGADLEKIASMTGLSKRVTQVWFQNSRARQKKWHQKSEGDNGDSQRSSVGPSSPSQKSDSSSEMMYPTSVTTSVEDAIPDSIVILGSLQFD